MAHNGTFLFNSNVSATLDAVCPDMSLCHATTGDNVGLAFGLTVAAGLSTTLGSLMPFVVRLDNVRVLAGCLALSAGVMLYVSFAEILEESRNFFCCVHESHDALMATGCFFAGIVGMVFLHALVHSLQHCGEARSSKKGPLVWIREKLQRGTRSKSSLTTDAEATPAASGEGQERPTLDMPRVSISVIGDGGAFELSMRAFDEGKGVAGDPSDSDDTSDDVAVAVREVEIVDERSVERGCPAQGVVDSNTVDEDSRAAVEARPVLDANERALMNAIALADDAACYDSSRLKTMGLLTCLAMGIHNFPEGIATFVATLANPSLGYAMCIAIALHNIPEGVCVAMPIYFATGSRWKGFLWATASGISEPIGALLGWAVLKDVFGPAVYGTLFGLIGGMMVFVALRELLPMAHKFDPHDRIVSPCVVLGMFVMAASLLLFEY